MEGNQFPLSQKDKSSVKQFNGLRKCEKEVPDVEAVVLEVKINKYLVKLF